MSSIPRIAIVGRPNVGKSSLMNMIARQRVSIVDPTPGVTRDRVAAVLDLDSPFSDKPSKRAELIDTGGFGIYTAEGRKVDDAGHDLSALTSSIEDQIASAVSQADVILFVFDAQAGVTSADRQIATLLRSGKLGHRRPGSVVRCVANKVDSVKWESHAAEGAALGFGEPLMVSAASNYRRRDLFDAIYELLPDPAPPAAAPQDVDPADRTPAMLLAIVGKRNAGKSTLVNTLAGQQRVIVSEIAGTTRDAIDVRFEFDGKTLVAIDTAGLRRKKSFADQIEFYALLRARAAIERCDVAFLMIDATLPVSQVDQQLAMMLQKSCKPTILVVNKWDLARGKRDLHGRPVTTGTYETYIRKEFAGLPFAPISFISAKDTSNIRETIDLAFELRLQARVRVNTGRLNRLAKRILETRGPANKLGSFAKVYFVTQVGVNPPTIACVVNRPELFTDGYKRFLLNRFREELECQEVPIRLLIRGKRRDESLDESAVRDSFARTAAAPRVSEEEALELFGADPDALLAAAGGGGDLGGEDGGEQTELGEGIVETGALGAHETDPDSRPGAHNADDTGAPDPSPRADLRTRARQAAALRTREQAPENPPPARGNSPAARTRTRPRARKPAAPPKARTKLGSRPAKRAPRPASGSSAARKPAQRRAAPPSARTPRTPSRTPRSPKRGRPRS